MYQARNGWIVEVRDHLVVIHAQNPTAWKAMDRDGAVTVWRLAQNGST